MTKIVYRDREERYYRRDVPEGPVRTSLRGDTREQGFCRERNQQYDQRREVYTDEDFDMYRDDVPHRRAQAGRAPSNNRKNDEKLPLWIVCSLVSAVGLFSMFAGAISIQMLGIDLGSFSPLGILLGKGSEMYENADIVDPRLTAISAAAFGITLFMFLRYKEETFSKTVPVLLLSIVPAGAMVFFISSVAKAPSKAIDIDVGLGVYLQIVCSAGLIILTLIGNSMMSKSTTRKGVSYGFR